METPDSGSITAMPPAATIGYLPQEPDRRGDETLLDYLRRRTGVAGAERAMEDAATAMGGGGDAEADAYSDALDRYLNLGGPDFDARAAATWDDLGLEPRLLSATTDVLSGGEAARASLAVILLSRFDVLLLDEPTNDLDFDGLERLERFVNGLDGGLVVVSHDRAFLDATITSVVEIDEHSHRAAEYGGGWSAYLESRSVARRHAEEAYDNYRSQRETLLERTRQQKTWAVQGVRKAKSDPTEKDKNIKAFRISSSEKVAAKAKQTERAMERLEVVDKPWEGWDLRMEIAAAPRAGAVVARLTDAVVDRGTFRLGPIDLEIGWGERVALLGPNGSGKTTLINVLLGEVELTSGDRYLGPGVVVGELGQRRARFLGEGSVLDAFIAETGLILSEARSLLAKFGLTADHVARPAALLSPGERTRAELARFMAVGVNTLILDEPTNHLDLPAIEQIEEALSSFEGTLLLVTHDRRLLDAVDLTRTIRLGE
jgi:ATPase subunit of ABC transporter with duplicated ATPase domains